ncbi:MAG: signal peptidase I [Bacillota bacterium]
MREYLPVKSTKLKSLLLAGLMLLLYIAESTPLVAAVGSLVFIYILKPLVWTGIIVLIAAMPRVRAGGLMRLRGMISTWAFNFAVIFIIISIGAGIIDGFGKSPYSNTITGMLNNLIILSTSITARELIRSYLVNSMTRKENYFIFILIAVFMTITNISINRFCNQTSYAKIVEFAAQYLAPEFCKNLLAVYLVYIGGAIPSIIYIGIMQFFQWYSPILPDLRWLTAGFIGILCPIFCLGIIQSIYGKESKQIKLKDVNKENTASWIVTCIVSIMIIWFAVGVFPVYPSVIATGSMEPKIKPGDIILVKQKLNIDDIQVGDIIQFRRDAILISHRVVEILDDKGIKSFRTKGDNNSAIDSRLVKSEEVKGKVVKVVPKLGWPTLLIKSKKGIDLYDIEF